MYFVVGMFDVAFAVVVYMDKSISVWVGCFLQPTIEIVGYDFCCWIDLMVRSVGGSINIEHALFM